MALAINADCIACGACDYVCPNDAILRSPDVYAIVPARCTECKGLYAEPQCIAACPVDCIVPSISRKACTAVEES